MAIDAKRASGLTAGVMAVLALLLGVEGGYVNHPSDPGGETNHGVTKAVAREAGYTGPMRDLPQERAAQILADRYIMGPGFGPLIEISQPVAIEAIDAGVNTGPAQPSRWFQLALNSLNRGGRDYADIAVDGKVGAGTIAAYRQLQRARGTAEACRLTVKLLDAQQAVYYLTLTRQDGKFEDFMPGWIINRVGNVNLAECR